MDIQYHFRIFGMRSLKVKSVEQTGLFGSGEKKMRRQGFGSGEKKTRRHSVSNTRFSSAAKDLGFW